MSTRDRLDAIESSLDEVWMDVAEIKASLAAINKRLDVRDQTTRLALMHTERLMREKERILSALGVVVAVRHG